jgi:hypothetical protein
MNYEKYIGLWGILGTSISAIPMFIGYGSIIQRRIHDRDYSELSLKSMGVSSSYNRVVKDGYLLC